MNIFRKILSFAIVTVLITASSFFFTSASYHCAMSDEGGGGLGLPHDQAEYGQSLIDSGMTAEEAFNQMCEEGVFDVWEPEDSGSSQTQTQSQSQPATEQPKQETPAKTYSHDYDKITDEARESFVHFSKDGVNDSMYLNIKADSVENVLTGKELNATNKNAETGKINFVEDGNVKFSWVIEAKTWVSEDDYTLDLTTKMEDYNAAGLTAYNLSVQDTTLPEGDSITLKVAVPYESGTEVGMYLKDENGVYTKAQTATIEDGFITVTYTGALTSYIVSAEDLTTLNVTEEPEPEPEAIVEESPEEATEDTVDVPEVTTETAETVEDETQAEPVKERNMIPVISAICLVVVLAAGGLIVYKKKKVNAGRDSQDTSNT